MFITFGLILLLSLINTSASTIIVDDDTGPWADYSSIQEALINATDGSIIRVYDGSYVENLSVGKEISFIANRSTSLIGPSNELVFNISVNNCTIEGFQFNDTDQGFYFPIQLNAANQCLISNNTFRNVTQPILLLNSNNNSIYNNTLEYGSASGIALLNSSRNKVYNNQLSFLKRGIVIASHTNDSSAVSEYNKIMANNISYTGYDRGLDLPRTYSVGIDLTQACNNSISFNTLYQNAGYAIHSDRKNPGGNNKIHHNNFIDNNIHSRLLLLSFSQSRDNEELDQWDLNNQGNYWSDYAGFDLDFDGIGDIPYNIDGDDRFSHFSVVDSFPYMKRIPDLNSTNTWIVDDNWIGADFSSIQDAIDASSNDDIIHVYEGTYVESLFIDRMVNIIGNGSSKTIINGEDSGPIVEIQHDFVQLTAIAIQGNSNDDTAIRLMADHCALRNLNISGISNGFEITQSSRFNLISHSRITDTTIGILIWTGTKNNDIVGNQIWDCSFGIKIENSASNQIRKNNITRNDIGIYLSPNAENNTIFQNNISSNFEYGSHINASSINRISENLFYYNDEYAIYINGAGATNNFIHNNSFLENGDSSSQAYDDEPGNNWDDGSSGNWWSDYSGSDDNDDGIGDTPYVIDGSITHNDSKDNFPLYVEIPVNKDPVCTIDSITPNPSRYGNNVTFIAEASDEDGHIVRYSWTSSLDGELYNGTEFNFSNDTLSIGNHSITLRVQDDNLTWSPEVSETIKVKANLTNSPPSATILIITPSPVEHRSDVTFDADGIDHDGEIIRFSWRSSIDGSLYNGTNGTIILDFLSVGNHTIYLRVMDNNDTWSEEVSDSLDVYDRNKRNRKPSAFIDYISPNPAYETSNVTLSGHGEDEDGVIIRHRWISSKNGVLYNGTFNNFTVSSLAIGSHYIRYSVLDDNDTWSEDAIVSLEILEVKNYRPNATINYITPPFALEGELVTFSGVGEDPDGHVISYQWISDLDGVIYNGPEPSFKFNALSNGTHNIQFQVMDRSHSWSDFDNTTIHINGIPRANIIPSSSDIIKQGEPITFTADGSDDSRILRYVWVSSIKGELYNGSYNSFTQWSLANGSHSIILKVQDDNGTWSKPTNTTININGLPVGKIESIGPNPAYFGELVSINISGFDDVQISYFSMISNLDGEFYNGSKTVFNSTTLTNGSHEVSLIVADSYDQIKVDSKKLHINIKPKVAITFPIINGSFVNELTIQGTTSDLDNQVSIVEISVDNGSWNRVQGTSKWRMHLSHDEYGYGDHIVKVRARDGYHYSEILTVRISLEEPVIRPEDHNESNSFRLVSILLLLGFSILLMAIIMIEPVLYFSTSALMVLYSKTKKERLPDQVTRAKIIEYIGANPGVHFSKMKKDLGLQNGNATYHLRLLEKRGFLRSINERNHRRFYPYGYKIPDVILSETEKEIVMRLKSNPKITQTDLAKSMDLNQSTISYHIDKLTDKQVVLGKGIRGWQVNPNVDISHMF